jgi:hypothetical protein
MLRNFQTARRYVTLVVFIRMAFTRELKLSRSVTSTIARDSVERIIDTFFGFVFSRPCAIPRSHQLIFSITYPTLPGRRGVKEHSCHATEEEKNVMGRILAGIPTTSLGTRRLHSSST